ncbi:MAG: hypothetical protein WBH66_01235, partial [Rectinemataceae bacterium]
MKTTKLRLVLALAILGIFASLVFARYAQLAFTAEKGGEASLDESGERGSIVDRNGRALAMDVPKYDISVWRPSTKADTFRKELPELAKLLGVPASSIASRYDDGSQNYFYVAKRISADAARPLIEAKKTGKFQGVQVDEVSGRLYPEGKLASHLIGFTGEGNVGLDGIEVKYENELKPKPRKASDGTGRLLDASRKVPRGDTVTLSIDANLQYMIEDVMGDAVKANGAETAFAIAMDVRTGEILAYVAEPGFDLNR